MYDTAQKIELNIQRLTNGVSCWFERDFKFPQCWVDALQSREENFMQILG